MREMERSMCIMYEGWGGKGPCVLCMRGGEYYV